MNSQIHEQYAARANIIKAIAHPSRLFIIEELFKAKKCVGELTSMIGSDTSTISKHLSILKNAGLIIDEKVGTSVFYKLKTPCVLDFINCIQQVLEQNAEKQMQIAACCKKPGL
jgi:ArsR family transcriptional regulator, arsenate/arsenite/antimonite-responsive transcriptional repressor